MLEKIINPIKYIINHPLTKDKPFNGVARFISWQIKSRLNPKTHIINWMENITLKVSNGMHGATGCIYVGLPEFRDMAFLLHFLNPNCFFIDIGANIGIYSLLAANKSKAQTISIEPIPQTFNYLKNNIKLNHLEEKVTCLNIGLADKTDYLYFTKDKDTVNHVVECKNANTVKVEVNTLDNIVVDKINCDTLIKLDVEGFELNVLNGGKRTLENSNLKAIIVELNGSGKRFGITDAMVDNILVKNNFEKYDYLPFKRQLIKLQTFHTEENTLYIRASEVDDIKKRLKLAPPFKIFNKII